MTVLLLQKPCCSSKLKDHVSCLERRFPLWLDGDLDNEGRAIQQWLPTGHGFSERNVTRLFMKLMFEGKTQEALHLLSTNGRGGLLHLTYIVVNL